MTAILLVLGVLAPSFLAAQTTAQPDDEAHPSPPTVVESIMVLAPLPPERPPAAVVRTVLAPPTIVGLPLNGRNFVALTALAPGVALPPGSPFPRINGGRPRTNEYLFDGISVLQPEPGQVPFVPVIDAIESLTIESNGVSAEYGRFNGGVVHLTTKSGTNTVSGTLFGFLRHEALNARNYFARGEQAKPLFRRAQLGGMTGGPLIRNRTFFFADYQAHRQKIGRTVISTVPTALQRQGIFTEAIAGRVPDIYDPAIKRPFANNTIPVERFDPVAASLLERYPLSTSPGTANNFRRTSNELNNHDQIDLRIDHRAIRDSVFARVSSFAERVEPVAPLPDGSGTVTGTPGPQDTRARGVALGYNRMFGGDLHNQLRAGETTRSVARRATTHAGGILPTYVVAGIQQLGSSPNTEADFSTGVRQIADTVTWLRGRHTLKIGFDVRWTRLDVVQPPSPAGLYQFSTLFTDLPGAANTGAAFASFLLGQVQSFSIDFQQEQIRNRAHVQEYFVQDDWRFSDTLTVNAGVRYTLNFPSYEQHDQAAVFNLDTQRLEFLGRDGNPRTVRRLHKSNVGPRLGLVRRMSERSVLRAGYGLVWIEQAGITTPFTTPSFPFIQTVSQRTLDNVSPAFVLANGPEVGPIELTPDAGLGQGVFAADRNLGSGYAQQWNLSLRREVSQRASIEFTYAGSKITRVGIPDTNLNQLSAETLALGSMLLERVPNPFYGRVPRSSTIGEPTVTVAQLLKPFPQYTTVSLYRNNVGNTSYHGVTARIERRFADGLSFSAAYTRSKLIDEASSVFDASVPAGPVASYPVADSFDRRRERDVSNGDMPNVFAGTAIWEVPGTAGVTVSAVVILQSGTPLAVTQQTNFNAFAGFGIQRPNRNADPGLPAGERSVARWFDTSAFSVAPQFTLGNSSRNPVRGPAHRNVDLAVGKRWRARGTTSVETRAEIFNLLNTPSLGAPDTVLGSAAFGSITSAGDPRVVQLALKFLF